MGIKLQNLIFTDITSDTQELFYKVKRGCAEPFAKGILLRTGTEISFLSYFNSFSADKWKKYTEIRNIFLSFQYNGAMTLRVKSLSGCSEKLIYEEKLKSNEGDFQKKIEEIDLNGILFLEITVEKDSELWNGGFFTTESLVPRDLKIAACICTFRREEFIEKNLKIFHEKIFKESPGFFEVFISDNARTLSKDLVTEFVHIYPNINSGGSGGFTRCVLEVMKSINDITHILFMDDDVLIHPESLFRLKSFLSIANLSEEHCIGGSFLDLDDKTFHYEVGAVWTKSGAVPRKHQINLKSYLSLSVLEIEEDMQYNGWWFSCFSLSLFRKGSNLPYPFFIKGDDIEFGIRNKLKIINLSGISVWHDALEKKYSDMTHYYFMRNDSILNCIHIPEFSTFDLVLKFWKRSVVLLSGFKYKSMDVLCEGLNHFLKGPKFLKNTDPEKNTEYIRSIGYSYKKLPEIQEEDTFFYKGEKNKITVLFRMIITMNKQFPFSIRSCKTAYSDMTRGTICQVYGYDTINYYDSATMYGFTETKDVKKFYKLLWKALRLTMQVFIQFRRLKILYKDSLKEYTGKDFWETYLHLKK